MLSGDPEEYVSRNKTTLVRIIKHSSDDFVRSLAAAAIIEFGDDATREEIIETLENLKNCDDNWGDCEC